MKDILKRREKKNALLLSAQKLIKKPPRKNKFKTQMDKVIKQIKTDIPKDINRKVCKKCFQIGHDSRSSICPINKEEKQRLLHKIKTKVLSTSIFDNMEDVISSSPKKEKTIESITKKDPTFVGGCCPECGGEMKPSEGCMGGICSNPQCGHSECS